MIKPKTLLNKLEIGESKVSSHWPFSPSFSISLSESLSTVHLLPGESVGSFTWKIIVFAFFDVAESTPGRGRVALF